MVIFLWIILITVELFLWIILITVELFLWIFLIFTKLFVWIISFSYLCSVKLPIQIRFRNVLRTNHRSVS